MYVLYRVVDFVYRRGNAALPSCLNFVKLLATNYNDGHLREKSRWFSLIYNISVVIFVILIFLGNRTYLASTTACSVVAGLSHVTYLLSVTLSVLNVFVTSQCLTHWKKWYEALLFIASGSRDTKFWPLILALGISLTITGVFAVTMPAFLKRSDDL